MGSLNLNINKLPEQSLQAFLENSHLNEIKTVIVEMDLPLPKILSKRDNRGYLCNNVIPHTAEELQEEAEITKDLFFKIKEIIKDNPNHLAPTRSFLIQVNSNQLDKLLSLSKIKRIKESKMINLSI